jgi:hypothetical protein
MIRIKIITLLAGCTLAFAPAAAAAVPANAATATSQPGAAHADSSGTGAKVGPNWCYGGIHTYTYDDELLEVPGWGGSGTQVDTYAYVDEDGHAQNNERWCLERANEGGWYLHPVYNSNLCLDVFGGSPYHSGQEVGVWNCNGRANQRFAATVNNGPHGSPTGGFIYPAENSNYPLTQYGSIDSRGGAVYWQ